MIKIIQITRLFFYKKTEIFVNEYYKKINIDVIRLILLKLDLAKKTLKEAHINCKLNYHKSVAILWYYTLQFFHTSYCFCCFRNDCLF